MFVLFFLANTNNGAVMLSV